MALEGIANLDRELGTGGGGIGRGTAPHGGGGLPQDKKDWLCPSAECGNKNFAWREACNLCGTAKPGLEFGPREGMGGGFLERQIRASHANVEVGVDGYDDFGRLKEKKRSREDRKAKEEGDKKYYILTTMLFLCIDLHHSPTVQPH